MKVKKMTRTRCECDFCGKKNWSIGHIGEATCPCCMIEDAPATDAMVDAVTGQGSLFDGDN